MNTNVAFCRELLSQARLEARRVGVHVPKGLTALKSGKRSYFIEAKGIRGQYFSADNAYEAKAKYIFRIIEEEMQS